METATGSMIELEFRSNTKYIYPFSEIDVDCTFDSPSGEKYTIPAFYDGDLTWRVRFTPFEKGEWTYSVSSSPPDQKLNIKGGFSVKQSGNKTHFVEAVPDKKWKFAYRSGEPCFLMGDTVYNLFGAAHNDMDIFKFLKRRKEQGFNYFRVRCQVSPFHAGRAPGSDLSPEDALYQGKSDYLVKSAWPWGGSPQVPLFDEFNLGYFQTLDRVLKQSADLDIGFEMILEAWGFEYPFNSRSVFLPEWEELWVRYLVARYDAFQSVYIWTLMNEYEYYPSGSGASLPVGSFMETTHDPVSERWAIRLARYLKGIAPHRHPVAVHNGPPQPPFAERFKRDLEAIDVVLFQNWGTIDRERAWLCAGIEESLEKALEGWQGSAIFAEYGYERNPALLTTFAPFKYLDKEHTRRGAWRGAFSGYFIIHGFENSWGPYFFVDQDQPGVAHLVHFNNFFTRVVPYEKLAPCTDIVEKKPAEEGYAPLCLASEDRSIIAVYLPAGGEVTIFIDNSGSYNAQWYDTRTGKLHNAEPKTAGGKTVFISAGSGKDKRDDWVLLLKK